MQRDDPNQLENILLFHLEGISRRKCTETGTIVLELKDKLCVCLQVTVFHLGGGGGGKCLTREKFCGGSMYGANSGQKIHTKLVPVNFLVD